MESAIAVTGRKGTTSRVEMTATVRNRLTCDGTERVANVLSASQSRCCCMDGAKCICGSRRDGVKRESTEANNLLEAMPTMSSLQPVKTKPRLTTAHSETTLTVFANGHHKPCHRLNNAAHTSGAPYKIPRSHTMPGTSGHAQRSPDRPFRSEDGIDLTAQRSVESLPLSNGLDYASFSNDAAGSSSESLSLPPPFENNGAGINGFDRSGNLYPVSETATDAQVHANVEADYLQSMPSQVPPPVDVMAAQDWPLRLTTVSSTGPYPAQSFTTSPTGEYLISPDNEWSFPWTSVDPSWSALDLPLDSTNQFKTLAQPPSFSGESNRYSLPAMTATSSGTESEIGEAHTVEDVGKRQSLPSEPLDWDEIFDAAATATTATTATTTTQSYRLSSDFYVNRRPSYENPLRSHHHHHHHKQSKSLDFSFSNLGGAGTGTGNGNNPALSNFHNAPLPLLPSGTTSGDHHHQQQRQPTLAIVVPREEDEDEDEQVDQDESMIRSRGGSLLSYPVSNDELRRGPGTSDGDFAPLSASWNPAIYSLGGYADGTGLPVAHHGLQLDLGVVADGVGVGAVGVYSDWSS